MTGNSGVSRPEGAQHPARDGHRCGHGFGTLGFTSALLPSFVLFSTLLPPQVCAGLL